jgi:hypothetical protein
MNTTKSVPDYEHIQNGVTWIGGTTHELQKQHIPGYAGHVKGLFAENIYGRNFARVTAECINDRHTKGIEIDKVNPAPFRTKSIEPPIKMSTSSPTSAGTSSSTRPRTCWAG